MKNEAHNLTQLVKGLREQDYHHEKIEFLLIDDHSTDATTTIAQTLFTEDPRFRLYSAPASARARTTVTGGKAMALAEGIKHARGEILLLTDADCEPPPSWARTMASMFSEDVAYVVGPVVERAPGLFGSIRAIDFLAILATSAGRIGMGKPVNSFGANAAFRKSAYERAGGFQFDRRLGDEEFLMHKIHEEGWGRVLFCADAEAKVVTRVPSSFEPFWRQRLRWASMEERYPSGTILVELGTIYLFYLLMLAAPILGLLDSRIFGAFVGFFVLKLLVDSAALRSASRILGEGFSFSVFFVSELFHLPYIVFVTIFARVVPMKWKEGTR
jgi:cellulose synthase/poly-beta-1,6-N-acetylglucosamine synthase-like glycosyltransferase